MLAQWAPRSFIADARTENGYAMFVHKPDQGEPHMSGVVQKIFDHGYIVLECLDCHRTWALTAGENTKEHAHED